MHLPRLVSLYLWNSGGQLVGRVRFAAYPTYAGICTPTKMYPKFRLRNSCGQLVGGVHFAAYPTYAGICTPTKIYPNFTLRYSGPQLVGRVHFTAYPTYARNYSPTSSRSPFCCIPHLCHHFHISYSTPWFHYLLPFITKPYHYLYSPLLPIQNTPFHSFFCFPPFTHPLPLSPRHFISFFLLYPSPHVRCTSFTTLLLKLGH